MQEAEKLNGCLSLDSKKATPNSPVWVSMINNAWRVGTWMEILYWRLNERWIVCLPSLPLLHTPGLALWFPETRQLIDVPWPMKKYMLQLCRQCWAQVCDKTWLVFVQSETGTSHKRPRGVWWVKASLALFPIYSQFLDSLSLFISLWLCSYYSQYLEHFVFCTLQK